MLNCQTSRVKKKGVVNTMKRWGIFALASCLILSSAVPAFAQDTKSNELETAISAVKRVVDIPAEYEDFDYSNQEVERQGKTVSSWYFYWSNQEEYGQINAVVEQGTYLASYSKYNKESKEGLGSISRDAGEKTAAAFLAKARPDCADKMKLVETGEYYSSYDTHDYQFVFYAEDIPVPFISAQLRVDRYTGDVTSYAFSFNEKLPEFPAIREVLSLAEGRKAYEEKLGAKLSYRSTYDREKKQLHIFPAYSLENERKAIDAKSGDVIQLKSPNAYPRGYELAAKEAGGYADQMGGFSYEEIKAIDNVSSVISKEKAESRLRSLLPDLSADMKVVHTSLVKNTINSEQYLWEIGFDHAYGIIDAKTEELLSFYSYDEDKSEQAKTNLLLSEAKAKEKAETFSKKVAGNKFAQCAYQEQGQNKVVEDVLLSAKVSEGIDEVYRFSYVRQVNGIDFPANRIDISVNGKNGKITQYNCEWYTNIQAPKLDNVISSAQAFALFDESGKLALHEEQTEEGKIVPVYAFGQSVSEFLLDAYTGAKVDWRGEPYKEQRMPTYQDLEGHWAEAVVKSLLENGYVLPGENFRPNEKITQIQFLRYLYSPVERYYTDDELYRMIIDSKVIKKEEKAPEAQVTRQEAAAFAVRYLGLQKAAARPEIFANPYSDQIEEAYGGYAALAYGLGIMKGDAKGRFNGTNAVTNAESAVIVYQVLQVK